MVSQQAEEVNEAASELTDIARELEGSTAHFKLTRSEGDWDVAPTSGDNAPGEPRAARSASGRRHSKAA
jgi:hypothetical protein